MPDNKTSWGGLILVVAISAAILIFAVGYVLKPATPEYDNARYPWVCPRCSYPYEQAEPVDVKPLPPNPTILPKPDMRPWRPTGDKEEKGTKE